MARIDPAARVRRHIDELLGDGPVDYERLVDELVARGLQLGPDPEERVDDVIATMPRVDIACSSDFDTPIATSAGEHEDLVFDRLWLLDGTAWTVPIDALDLASDTIDYHAVGSLFGPLLRGWCGLDGGDGVAIDFDDRRVAAMRADPDLGDPNGPAPRGYFALPEGWLAAHGAQAGGWIELRLEGETVTGTAVDQPTAPSPELVAALGRLAGRDAPVPERHSADDVLTALFFQHPEFRGSTLAPLDDCYAAAGLERRRSWIAPDGFDFAADLLEAEIADAVDFHDFDPSQAAAYRALALAWHQYRAGLETGEDVDVSAAARHLDNLGAVAMFIEDATMNAIDAGELDTFAQFGHALRDATAVGKRRARAAVAWLIAHAHAYQGHTVDYEEWVETAHEEDPHHPGVIYDQAWFAFDRGEARKARALLEQLDMPSVRHDIAILDEVLAPATLKVGRNDPCPCGSGRKYKQCHLGSDETGLDDRLTWLYRKANWWLGFHHRDEVEAVASIRGRHSPLSTAQLLATDPLIADAVLTEGGRFAEWLDERGALLPGDEAMLAGQWALIGRSVFEVTDIRLDEAMTLRDVRTGDIIDVDERSGTHDLAVGTYLLARPLPTGSDRFQFFGGLTHVPDHALDRFIETLDNDASPLDLVALVADTEAPPSVTNRDGDETVFCESVWHLADPDAAAVVLDTIFEVGEAPRTWLWVAQADDEPSAAVAAAGGRTLRGNLRIEDDQLVATTNSVERNEQLTGSIAEQVPDTTLVEALQSSLDDVQADREYEAAVYGTDDGEDDDDFPGMLDPTDAPAEIKAVLRQQMDAYEEAWVDESLPALGGATPRQALEDPTRRDDLFRMLDQMDRRDASLSEERRALGMRPARLRELLGLEK